MEYPSHPPLLDPQWLAAELLPFLRYAFSGEHPYDYNYTPHVQHALQSIYSDENLLEAGLRLGQLAQPRPVALSQRTEDEERMLARVFMAVMHRHNNVCAEMGELIRDVNALTKFLVSQAVQWGAYKLVGRKGKGSKKWVEEEARMIEKRMNDEETDSASSTPPPAKRKLAPSDEVLDPRLLCAQPGEFVGSHLQETLTVQEDQVFRGKHRMREHARLYGNPGMTSWHQQLHAAAGPTPHTTSYQYQSPYLDPQPPRHLQNQQPTRNTQQTWNGYGMANLTQARPQPPPAQSQQSHGRGPDRSQPSQYHTQLPLHGLRVPGPSLLQNTENRQTYAAAPKEDSFYQGYQLAAQHQPFQQESVYANAPSQVLTYHGYKPAGQYRPPPSQKPADHARPRNVKPDLIPTYEEARQQRAIALNAQRLAPKPSNPSGLPNLQPGSLFRQSGVSQYSQGPAATAPSDQGDYANTRMSDQHATKEQEREQRMRRAEELVRQRMELLAQQRQKNAIVPTQKGRGSEQQSEMVGPPVPWKQEGRGTPSQTSDAIAQMGSAQNDGDTGASSASVAGGDLGLLEPSIPVAAMMPKDVSQ